jgi:hypothetical protein
MLRQRIGSLSLSALAAAVTIAVPLAMVTTETAQAAQCYGYVTYHADGKSKSYAINAAIGGWSSYVASKYGKSYSYWSHAIYKSTWCSQYDYYWTCWAKAEPCYWAPSYKPSYKPSYHKSYGGGGGGY